MLQAAATLELGHQIAVIDAKQLEPRAVEIECRQGHARTLHPRQNEGAIIEGQARGTVLEAGIDDIIRSEPGPALRRQALEEPHFQPLAMQKTAKAQITPRRPGREFALPRHPDIILVAGFTVFPQSPGETYA